MRRHGNIALLCLLFCVGNAFCVRAQQPRAGQQVSQRTIQQTITTTTHGKHTVRTHLVRVTANQRTLVPAQPSAAALKPSVATSSPTPAVRPRASGDTITSQSFGNSTIGSTGTTLYVPVNLPPGTNGTAATIVGDAGFQLGPTGFTCGPTSCLVQVIFTPGYPGLRTAVLLFSDITLGLIDQVYLYGTGIAPQFAFDLGDLTTVSGILTTPGSIALGPRYTTYIGDTGTNTVVATRANSSSTVPLTGLGTPAGITSQGNNVYIVDQSNNRVILYSLNYGQGTLATSQLSAPTGIAVDATGAIYIADTGNNRVIRIDNQGAETTIASGLSAPLGIALDGAGNVYFSDHNFNGEITEIPAAGGALVSIAKDLGALHDIAVDAGNRIYYSSDAGFGLISPDGSIADYGGGPNYGMTLDSNGSVLMTQPGAGTYTTTDRSASNFVLSTAPRVTVQGGDTISNTGNTPLTLSDLTIPGTVFTLDSTSGCVAGEVLLPGQACSFVVDFTPPFNLSYEEPLTATSNTLNVPGSTNFDTLIGNATQLATATTLTAAPANAAVGTPVTLTASVASMSPSGGVLPSGTVNFIDNGQFFLGSSTISSTTMSAQLVVTSLATGVHSITAAYQGDPTFVFSTSPAQTVTVGTGISTTTALSVSPASVAVGQAETLSAVITPASISGMQPDGSMNYLDTDGTLIGTSYLSGYSPTTQFITSSLAAGVHSITAVYSGDQTYSPSTSAPQTVTVTSAPVAAPTTLSLSTTASNAVYKAVSTLVATAQFPATGLPVTSGQVVLCPSTAIKCTPEVALAIAQINQQGSATFKFVPGILGSHAYEAVFLGTQTALAATSAPATITVSGTYPDTTTLTATGNPGAYTLTAAITGPGTGTLSPTGTMSFNDTTSASVLGTSALVPAAPTFAFSPAANGTYTVGASPYAVATGDFNGDGFADIVTANSSANADSVTVLLGHGDGTFGPAANYAAGAQPQRVLVADFNGDGLADLVVSTASSFDILLGNGDGTFQTAVSYATVGQPGGLAILDLNHDGFADLAVGGFGNVLSVFLNNGDGTFKSPVVYSSGTSPQNVAEGDFNGDGNIDIAVSNFYSFSVDIYLGNGDGTFQAAVAYSTGIGPSGLAVGDLNGDGKDDLAVVNNTDSTISVLLGRGDGTLQAQVAYPIIGLAPQQLVLADFNGDGKLDIATGGFGGATQNIFLGNGDGSLQTPYTFAGPLATYGMAAADFDGDGLPDLALVANAANTVGIYLSQVTANATATLSNIAIGSPAGTHQVTASYPGDTSFAPSVSAPVSLAPVVVTPAVSTTALIVTPASATTGQAVSFNVAVSGTSQTTPVPTGTVSVTFNSNDSTLATLTLNATGSATFSSSVLAAGTYVFTAQYSGDTVYAASTSAPQTLTITAPANLATTVTLSTSGLAVTPYEHPIALAIGVTASNNTPVTAGQVVLCSVTALTCTAEQNLGIAAVRLGRSSNLSITPGTVGTHTYKAVYLGVAGLLASTSAPLTITVTGSYPTTSTITASTVGGYTLTGTVVGLGSNSLAPGGSVSFNDTTADTVLGTQALGAATLAFNAVQPAGSPIAVGGSPYGVATGDFNNDGFLDTVTGNYKDGTVSVLLGNGDGTFKPQVIYAVGSSPERVLVADVSGDGNLDLIVANTASNTVSILIGNGDGTFQPQVTYAALSAVGLGVLDLNHDGFPDIVAGGYYDDVISVLINHGDGTFAPAVTYPAGHTPQTLTEGDFNGDGNIDIAVGNFGDANVGVFLGKGDGTFASMATYTVGSGPQGVQTGDFNADGKEDLAVVNSSSNNVSILLGNGDGTFQPQVTYATGLDPVGLVVADFNGDGKQDLAVNNTAQSALTESILLGNGDGTFQPQTAYPMGNFPYGSAAGDFNGDGYPDLAITNFNDGTATILLSQVTETASTTLANVTIGSPAGNHQIDISYPGDANFSASVSPATALASSSVAPTSTTLVINPFAPTTTQAVTISVSVSGLQGAFRGPKASGPIPSGTVTLSSAGVTPAPVLGIITLDATGAGTLTIASLAAGTYTFTAAYSGDSNYAPSTSNSQVVQVTSATRTGPIVNSQGFGNATLGGTPATFTLTYAAPASTAGLIAKTAQGTVFTAQPVACSITACTVQLTFTPTYPGLATDAITLTDASGTLLARTYLYGVGIGPQVGYELAYGTYGTYPSTLLKSPASVAVGPDNNVYVADTAGNVVAQVIPGNALNFADATALPIAGLGRPGGIAVAGDNTLFVADQTNSVVRSYNLITGGQSIAPATGLSAPSGIAVDGTGALYVADTGNHRILKIDNQGVQTVLATPSTQPTSLTLDSTGDLFYADAGNGGEITEIPASGAGNIVIGSGLGSVGDLAVEPSGRVFFAGSMSVSNIVNGVVSTNGYFNLAGNPNNTGMALTVFGDVITTNTSGGTLAATYRRGSSFHDSIPLGTTNTCCDSISNTGNSPLTVSALSNSGANYSLATGPAECAPGTVLSPAQGCSVAVSFSPSALQTYADTVTVTSNSLNIAGSTNLSTVSAAGQQIPTATTLVINPSATTVGQAVTFTANLAFTSTFATAPSGTVQFVNANGTILGSAIVAGTSATFTTSSLVAGSYNVTASYAGDTFYARSISSAAALSIAALTPQTITFPAIPNHLVGDAPFALGASASSGLPVSYAVTAGPATISGSTVTLSGAAGTVTIQATQPGNALFAAAAPVSQSFTVAAVSETLASISPTGAALNGPATTVTLIGTNFASGDVVHLSGATIPTTYVSSTTLTAIVPSTFFTKTQTGLLTVFDPVSGAVTPGITFAVLPAVQVVFSGPSTATSNEQPTITFQLVNPYPYPLTGTLNLAFAPANTASADDPMVVFAQGGRSLAFTIPANSTAVPTVTISTGTTAGTVTVSAVVTSNGVNVTPASVTPVVITIPPTIPAITSTASIVRNGSTFTLAMIGYSNTREVSQATFHFTPKPGSVIDTPDLTLNVVNDFSAWFTSTPSDAYGTQFTYTQDFTLNMDSSLLDSVTVTLTNSVGASITVTAQ